MGINTYLVPSIYEDTHPVIRAIGVSHTACKTRLDEIFDLTPGVCFHLS